MIYAPATSCILNPNADADEANLLDQLDNFQQSVYLGGFSEFVSGIIRFMSLNIFNLFSEVD